jgi:hypothetical protein
VTRRAAWCHLQQYTRVGQAAQRRCLHVWATGQRLHALQGLAGGWVPSLDMAQLSKGHITATYLVASDTLGFRGTGACGGGRGKGLWSIPQANEWQLVMLLG